MLAASVGYAQERQITIPMERWGIGDVAGADAVEVTDLDGRDVTRTARQRVAGEQLQVLLPEQGALIVRPADTVSLRLPRERITLPGGIVQPGDSAEQVERWIRPTIAASPVPVSWDAALRRYRTALLLGLRLPPEAEDVRLDEPVTMRLRFRGMRARPVDDVRLRRTGLEHEQRVELRFLPTTSEPVLELRSPLGDVDLAIDVLPRLELRPVGDTMPGLGLGTVAVDVVHLLPHGVAAPVDAETNVSLEIDGSARPEEDRVVIPADGSLARFTLRSTGFGPVNVTATARGLRDSRTIEQTLPFTPLIAVLLGGALGGYSRRFRKGAGDATSRARVIEGALVALVAYAAVVVGVVTVAIPAGIAATEAGAFLTGALAGFLGVGVIETLSRRLHPAGG